MSTDSSQIGDLSSSNSTDKQDKTELNDLLKQLDTTILNLEKKRKNLLEQINELKTSSKTDDEYETKLKQLQNAINEFDEKLKEAYSVKENLNKFEKQSQIAFQMAQQQLENPNDQFNENEIKLNEEGLPFMDIQEEVDDDGNIINSKINNVEFENNKNDSNDDDNGRQLKKKKSNQKIENNDDVDKKNVIENKSTSTDNDNIKELFDEMEVYPQSQQQKLLKEHLNQDELLEKIDQLQISPEEKFNLKKICIESFKNINEDSAPNNEINQGNIKYPSGLDRNNLIELELLADEIEQDEEHDDGMDNNEEFDYEFDDDEDDDEDDDYADQLLYGNDSNTNSNLNSSWIGKNNLHNQSNKMFYDQIMNLRNKNRKSSKNEEGLNDNDDEKLNEIPKTDDVDKKSKKSVRFSNDLDIKNIENISNELKKNELLNSRKSLFKQNRLRNNERNQNLDEDIVENEPNNEGNKVVEDMIIEKESPIFDNDSITGEIIDKDKDEDGDIILNGVNESNDGISTVNIKKPVSRFKAMKQEKKPIPIYDFQIKKSIDEKDNAMGSQIQNINDIEENQKQDDTNDDKKQLQQTEDIKDTNLDYQNLNKDMDTMAKAYIMGMYDDDLENDGIIIEELNDFEKQNKIVEEKEKQSRKEGNLEGNKNKNKNDVYDFKSNEIGMDIDDDDNEIDETNEVMTNDIIENDVDEYNDDENDNENNDDDYTFNSNILNKEIKQDYNKLKQKFKQLYSNNESNNKDKEFEPIDEFGNTIKISRFKSNNINNNSGRFN
ncbi:uncharacterized protein KGF55_002306 [Candida pseudojiufengensis]|uniref:uncharacterized protein n=1 Tax=Candida pseudojiufengensis TaxID=497109 RepID=UPI002224F40A|nr:uncharacterized protein KGF55_002306 [Candida pseudojiufengensis]KAI5964364.1 hypothetical protein KGF55_002306 [Candida pseudojiufengensis]